jgi:hypothetical protein
MIRYVGADPAFVYFQFQNGTKARLERSTNPFTISGSLGRYKNTGLYPDVTAGERKAAAVSSVDRRNEV